MTSNSNSSETWQETSTTFPEISSVRLYPETIQHIEENHPEVMQTVGAQGVLDAVGNPTRVLMGNTGLAKSFVFVSGDLTYGDATLHVPVKFVTDKSARVRTAYYRRESNITLVYWSSDYGN